MAGFFMHLLQRNGLYILMKPLFALNLFQRTRRKRDFIVFTAHGDITLISAYHHLLTLVIRLPMLI